MSEASYKPRTFTYRPLVMPDDTAELASRGFAVDMLPPGTVVVINVERDIPTGQVLDSLAEFNARFELAE